MSSPALSIPAEPGRIVRLGNAALRGGLALVLIWIGCMKFTAYEAMGIRPLVATSPLLSWLYRLLSVQAASNLIGVAELTIAVLILLRPVSAVVALIGGAGAIGTFLVTLSFMVSLPGGVWAEGHGFPMLGDAGGFLIKDVVLLGAALAIAAEAYAARAAQLRGGAASVEVG